MKRLFILLLLGTIFTSCKQDTPRVLLFIRDGAADLEFMLKEEVGVAKKMLEQAGIEVVVATLAGEPITAGSTELRPDLKLSDVRVADYQGFILPCMAAGASPAAPETIAMVEKAAAEGKPVAAQRNAVRTLAKSGVLVGKRHAFGREIDVTELTDFKGGLYSGTGVIQDGNIITSGICPYAARTRGVQHGTEELTRTLIEVIKARSK